MNTQDNKLNDAAENFKEVDLDCQNILLKLGILKTSNGLTYDTYTPTIHVSNLVKAMKEYAKQLQLYKQVGAEPFGWVFKGKFFKDENDMRGMTMHEGNVPIPVYQSLSTPTISFSEDGWIRVKDRLPEVIMPVQVFIAGKFEHFQYGTGFIDKLKKWSVYYDDDEAAGYYPSEYITHWQLLPKPPSAALQQKSEDSKK